LSNSASSRSEIGKTRVPHVRIWAVAKVANEGIE
jgi:hypothetical protein